VETIIRKCWRFVRCDKDNFYEERYLERRGVPPSFISEIIAVKRKKKRFTTFSLSSSFSLFFSFRKAFVNLDQRRVRSIFIALNLGELSLERNSLARERRHFGRLWQFLSCTELCMFRIAVFTIDLDRYVNAYVHEHSSLCQIGRSGTIPERRQYTPCVTRSTFRKTDKLLNVFCEVDILDIVMYLITFS